MMQLRIVLTKEVPDIDQAQIVVDIVKIKLADHPEIDIRARLTTELEID